jgi:predicted dehydrogenase
VSAAERDVAVGVVGVGHLGSIHARIYADLPGVRLVGVVDRDVERARSVARAHGCAAYDRLSELIGRIDAASVAVPTEAHRDVAERLLEAGVHVLVEKPLARTLEEADSVVATAARCGRHVMVGHSERFNPAARALARVVREPRFFEIHRLAGFTARSTDIDVVLDLMIHDLDLLLHLDGTEAASIDAVGVHALTERVDIANARIRMASGAVANITASRISTEPVRRVRVFQARTYLACDTIDRSVDVYRVEPGERGAPRIAHERLEVEQAEPLGLELAAFVDSVDRGRPPPVDGVQGRRALDLALRVRAAIEAG